MEFDEYGNLIPGTRPDYSFGQRLGNFFGVGPDADMLNQQGLSDPRAAAWSQALNNIVQMNMGHAPQQTPFSAAFDVRRQNAILMDRKYQNIEEQRRFREAQQLRDEQLKAAQFVNQQNANAVPNPYQNLPASIQEWKISGSKLPFEQFLEAKNPHYFQPAQPTAAMQDYQYMNSLPPAQQAQFAAMKRGAELVRGADGSMYLKDALGNVTPYVGHALATTQQADVAGAKTTATEQAQAAVARQTSAPSDIATGEQLVSLIDMAIQHPGREAATGASSVANSMAIPGTDRADYLTLAEQLKGNAFLQAYQSLKGGGPITDREGAAATAAQSRLNESQSEASYKQALEEMKRLTRERLTRIPQSTDEDLGSTDGY